MKTLMNFIWELWLFLLFFAQEFGQYLSEALLGLNPLRIDQRKMFPALARRDGSKSIIEVRSFISEIRAVDDEEGIAEAYLTKWGTVDDYNSTFKRGAFKKTFSERKGKIRLLFNHSTLCGKVIEAREDSTGPLVRCKFNLDTTAGKDAWAHVREGDVDCFSFGFLTVQDGRTKAGVREIREVKCFECGPVIFEANGEATITQVRSLFAKRDDVEIFEEDKTIEERRAESGEGRSQDFEQTLAEDEMRAKGWRMLMALEDTIYEIWYNNTSPTEVIAKIDEAIASFHAAYVAWAADYMDMFWSSERQSCLIPFSNDLMQAFHKEFSGKRSSLEDLAKTSPFTLEELELLSRGRLLPAEKRDKLKSLPESVAQAHHSLRRTAVEDLCREIRSIDFSRAEKTRFAALLGIAPDEMLGERASGNPPSGEEDVAVDGLFDEIRSSCSLLQHGVTPAADSAEED